MRGTLSSLGMNAAADTAGGPVHSASVLQHGAVRWVLAGDEAVVQVPALGITHVLDPASAVLWQCLDGVSSLVEIFGDMADVFGVEPAVIERDCLPVVRSWFDAGIAVVPGTVTPAELSLTSDAVEGGRTWRRLVDPPST